jgi:methylmalonyl-CoA/ethylmalonyl-CoA epimerase
VNAELLAVLHNPQLHHVGVVVKSEKLALAQMARLGLQEDYRGYVPTWDVWCIFAQGNGGSPLEFVVPGPTSTLRDFNQGLGGLHHLAFTVPDLLQASAQLAALGVKMVSEHPVQGAGPFVCNFIPPIFTRGYAVELVQLQSPAAAAAAATATATPT